MKRKHSLDILKVMCAFMVVHIHSVRNPFLDHYVIALCRIAVPLFFMITGYYYTRTTERKNERKQIAKIFWLFVSAYIMYFCWLMIKCRIENTSAISFILGRVNLKSILFFLFLSYPIFGEHLWYLLTLIGTLVIVYLFEKKWNRQKLYPLVPVLFLVNLLLGTYSFIFPFTTSIYYTRNAFFVGLPFFLIGDMIYNGRIKTSAPKALILSFVFVGVMILETYLLQTFEITTPQDYTLSPILLSISVFLFTLQCDVKCSHWFCRVLCFIGSKLTTGTYILHPIVITLLPIMIDYVSRFLKIVLALYYIRTIAAFIGTVLLVWLMQVVNKAFKRIVHSFASNGT